jgi:hypothetical protein
MILYKNDILINSDFEPIIVAFCENKKAYCMELPKQKNEFQSSKNFLRNSKIENIEGVVRSESETIYEKYFVADPKKVALLNDGKDYEFWFVVFSVSYFLRKLSNFIKSKVLKKNVQPLPYWSYFVVKNYADLLKHQHFTRVAKEYLKDKKELIKWCKNNKESINNETIDLSGSFQMFGTQYDKTTINKVIKHLKYLNKWYK